MKKIIIPLALVLGTIASEVNAQTVVFRRPVRRVVVVPPVVIAPRPVVIIPRPIRVIPTPVSPPPSTTVVRKRTVIHKL